MTASARADEPYSESEDFAWTVKAYNMMVSGELHAQVISRDDVVTSRVWGPCPRCGDTLDDRQTHTAVTDLIGTLRRNHTLASGEAEERYFPVDVSCRCGRVHDGTPQEVTGCGISFRVELPVSISDALP
jgi:hypothetical protein